MFKPPFKGKTTIQKYAPERGEQYQYQVSTYTGTSWLIDTCSGKDINRIVTSHRKTINGL